MNIWDAEREKGWAGYKADIKLKRLFEIPSTTIVSIQGHTEKDIEQIDKRKSTLP